jgi:phosphoribosylformimino-5-aminoimidazole carboxamide ribotide isomerase
LRSLPQRDHLMELYPAIDLRDGGAVRLTQGDFDREVRYGDPLALTERFIEGGSSWIHVVDLNAARTGVAHERTILAKIVELARSAGVTVQTGGGIRTEDDVATMLDLGVARVVLGTTALKDPALTTRCARRWPGRVAIGLDYAGADVGVGRAQSNGWEVSSPLSIPSVLEQWEGEPIGAVVATSIARDGMLAGPDLAGMRSLLALTPHPVIASGGVGSLEDLRALAGLSLDEGEGEDGGAGPGRDGGSDGSGSGSGDRARVAGAIVGKALVERRFSVEEAVAACTVSA